jgi:hypothetical protein
MKGQKSGGRKKGTPNKDSLSIEQKAQELGFDPLKVLIHFAQGDWKSLGYDSEVYHMEKADGSINMGFVITPNMRMTATETIMKYIYPQKKAVELSTPAEGMKIIVEDYRKK